MTSSTQAEYLRSAVLTATPEQLQMMLYDGAIRFATQAREALEHRRFDQSCELLLKAQRIVLELENGLRPEVAPSLCKQLGSLYRFIYRRLVDANTQQNVEAIDDALRILKHQRETWELVIQKLRDGAPSAEVAFSTAPPNASPSAHLSIEC